MICYFCLSVTACQIESSCPFLRYPLHVAGTLSHQETPTWPCLRRKIPIITLYFVLSRSSRQTAMEPGSGDVKRDPTGKRLRDGPQRPAGFPITRIPSSPKQNSSCLTDVVQSQLPGAIFQPRADSFWLLLTPAREHRPIYCLLRTESHSI